MAFVVNRNLFYYIMFILYISKYKLCLQMIKHNIELFVVNITIKSVKIQITHLYISSKVEEINKLCKLNFFNNHQSLSTNA